MGKQCVFGAGGWRKDKMGNPGWCLDNRRMKLLSEALVFVAVQGATETES